MAKLHKSLEKVLNSLSPEEQKVIAKQITTAPRAIERQIYRHDFGRKQCKIGIISDTHIGSKFFDGELFDKSVQVFNREKVDAVYHAGDIIEGMSNREGHMYELDTLGVTAQVDQAVDLLNQYSQPLFFIAGNHDGWSKIKSNQGVDINGILESRIKGSKNLGNYEADIELGKGCVMRLTHGGNGAYALSYPLQKSINGLEGGSKPQILVNGHLHKALYMNYRNIHAVEASTMQHQTPFMAMKGSPAMMGFWIFDINYGNGGVMKFSPEYYPFYKS